MPPPLFNKNFIICSTEARQTERKFRLESNCDEGYEFVPKRRRVTKYKHDRGKGFVVLSASDGKVSVALLKS